MENSILIVGNNHFQRFVFCRVFKDVVRLFDLIEAEPVSYQLLGLKLARFDRIKKHRRRICADEAGRDGDVADPQLFEVKLDAFAMYADIRNVSACGDNFLAEREGRGNSDRFNRYIDAFIARKLQYFLNRFAVGGIHHFCRSEFLGDFEAVVIQIDHNDFSGRIELGCQQRGQAYGASAYNG